MKKILLTLTAVFLITNSAFALNLSRVKEWSSGEVLTDTDLNAEFDNVLDHSITNSDISASAAITASKLDLTVGTPIGSTTASTGAFSTLSATGNVTFDTNTLFLNATTNRVGIGTTSPVGPLHIAIGTTYPLCVTTVGNVGIGTTGPTSLFYVDGTATVTTAAITTLTATNVGAFTLTGKLTAGSSEIEGSTFDINGGTIDGITALTAAGDLDIGAYELRAQTLEADVATGTAPLTIASTTEVDNLNADYWNGMDATTSITSVGTIATGVWNGTDIALGYGGIGSTKIDYGSVSCSATSTANITFAFTFGATPKLVTGVAPASGAPQYQLLITALSTTGATVSNGNGQDETVYWIAMGAE